MKGAKKATAVRPVLAGVLAVFPEVAKTIGEGLIAGGAAVTPADPVLGIPAATVGMVLKYSSVYLAGIIGYVTNRLASAADAEAASAPANAAEVGLNHHLARLAAYALRTVIEEQAAAQPAGSVEREALTQASRRAEQAWLIVLEAPSGEQFRRLNSVRLTDAAAGEALTPGGVEVLNATHWLPFARYVLDESGAKSSPSALVTALAAKCERDFSRHFLEHAKLSLEKDPPAFAALLIQFLADMRFALREHDAEFAGLRTRMDQVMAQLDVLARATVSEPGFKWERLTAFLAESTAAYAEARTFYQAQGRNWLELLPLARDTWKLVREIHTTHHQELLQNIAGLNLLVQDKVLEVLRNLRRQEQEPHLGAAMIVEFVRAQHELDQEARRQFEAFILRRDDIQGRGGHHYHQPDKWSPGHRTRKLWREPGIIFVPRKPLLGADDVPPAGSTFYLHGESGHGKSILAANIAHRLMAKGYRALTFNLRQAGDILRHLALLTDKEWLGLDKPTDHEGGWDETAKVVAACTWLLEEARPDDDRHPPYCLVWDNADDRVTLDHLLQLQLLHHRGVQIITTRIPPNVLSFPTSHPCHDWPIAAIKYVHVGPYTQAEAHEYLRQHLEEGSASGFGSPPAADHERILAAASLADRPGFVDPLELHDVLSALQMQHWNVDAVLGTQPLAPATKAVTPTSLVPAPTPSHRQVLEQTLAGLTPLTRAVWHILVWLAPAPIPESFWSAIEEAFSEPYRLPDAEHAALQRELKGRLPFVRARSALAEAGLLTGGEDGDLVHTRHHALGRELTPPNGLPTIHRQIIYVLCASVPDGSPHDDLSTWPLYRAMDGHLLTALAPERKADIVTLLETAWLTNQFNTYLLTQSRLVEAAAIAQLNLEASLAASGEGSPNHATLLKSKVKVITSSTLFGLEVGLDVGCVCHVCDITSPSSRDFHELLYRLT